MASAISLPFAVTKPQYLEQFPFPFPHEPNCTQRPGRDSKTDPKRPVAKTSAAVKAHMKGGNHRPASQKPQAELVRRLAEVK